ncbi:hypothetical protein ARMGADRAFT_1031290 [Armillaria gallica]|uniref:Uncharacterized protein n=1 Tax=Armillaria gallica TaxID=47427 RepID=A0A2H3DJZ3_ARMGA|nr:hypothetical protein ARMGADRAFT_1031290 [Armillaria gallica]
MASLSSIWSTDTSLLPNAPANFQGALSSSGQLFLDDNQHCVQALVFPSTAKTTFQRHHDETGNNNDSTSTMAAEDRNVHAVWIRENSQRLPFTASMTAKWLKVSHSTCPMGGEGLVKHKPQEMGMLGCLEALADTSLMSGMSTTLINKPYG